ncbi:hypothetical protein HK103_000041 [Boothiomyces macroporosus]|uniref:Uncharacterized protein n=1 Tax=Boothiomyces macroporosus TaxID=261099 RepID=A0AAD5YBE3_9FUNG|nr:hypothetical protein HK103_000041 [Boothiomyces macroporosus]
MIQSPSEHIGLNINDLTTTPHIEYKLMDEFLSLKSPYLSPAITDYLQGDKAIQDFVNRITLYKDRDFMYKESQNDPLVGVSFDKDNQDSVISLEIVNYERPRNSDLKESFIAMELITKPHNLLKKVYTDELVNQIFLILKPAAKGSLFHFRKIFMTALIYHPRLLFSFKSWIFLMVKQIINQPVQDAIVCCFTAIYTKKYLDSEDSLYAMIRDSGFLDCMFTKMVSSDIQIVRAFCSTILRILNILDLHDCNTLLCNYNAEKESDSNSNLPKMFENIVKMLDSSDSEIRNEIIDFVANMKFTGYCEPIKLQFMKALESQSHIVASVDLLKQYLTF